MQKILITNKYMSIGGVETSLLYFLESLDYTKYKVDLLLYEKGILLKNIPKEVNVIYYKDYMLLPFKFLYGLKKNVLVNNLYDKYRFAFKKKYDIAIAYNGFDNYVDMIAASVHAKKKIIWVHNDFKSALDDKRAKWFYKIMWSMMSKKYKYFDKIVCVSKYTKENFDFLFPQYKDKTISINNLIDGDKIRTLAREKTTIKLGKQYNIVSIGRLTITKNIHKLINLHKQLIDTGHNVKTYIIGDGKESYHLADQIRKLGLNSSVIMLGEMDNPYNILKQADLLVSMSSFESFGNVLLEAMILDVPFVSNINSGSKDIYENIMPKNGGVIVENDKMYDVIVKQIKKWQKHISFDDIKYNQNIVKLLNNLLESEENE